MPIVRIEVKKNTNENNANLLRRFSRRMIEAGTIQKVKGARYAERATSKLSLKTIALRKIGRRKEVEKLRKMGKMA